MTDDLLGFLSAPRERKALLRDVAREAANRGDMPSVFAALGYTPHAKQAAFHDARDSYRRRVLLSGRRFGKTVASAMEACFEVLRDGPTRTLVLAPIGELSERTFRVIRSVLVRQLGFTPERLHDTPQRREVVMQWGSGIVCRSCVGEDAVLGDAYDLAVLDEAARMPAHVWEADVEPALADRDGHAVFASSPHEFGWYHHLWRRCESPDFPGWWGIHGRTADNPQIPPSWLKARKAEVSPEVYRREYLGEFVSLDGCVFPEWDPDTHVTPDATFDPAHPVLLSFDFGTTEASPFAVIVAQDIEGVLRVVDELVVAGHSTLECASRLAVWWTHKGYPTGETRLSVGDIAAADAKRTLQTALQGRGILGERGLQSRKQTVEEGVEVVRQRLRAGTLLVHPRCTILRSEFAAYTWRASPIEGGPERGVRKAFDHLIDSLRYLAVWLANEPAGGVSYTCREVPSDPATRDLLKMFGEAF